MKDIRIAWLVPSVELGAYWQPVLREFTQVYPNTLFYTGQVWPGFDPEQPGCSAIEIVGETKFVETQKVETGYGRGFIVVSPSIIGRLLKFKPDIVFPQAFSLWTVFAVLLKPIFGWKLAIIYDGSSPNTDFRDSGFRTVARKWLAKFADAFVSNSEAGKQYLMEALGVPESKIMKRVYLVPDAKALQRRLENTEDIELQLKRPTFLYVGRITQRKGIKTLLGACAVLKERGIENFNLLIVGKGDQREELEAFIRENGFEEQVIWAGWVEYGKLGLYFQQADVFVFPTYEDVWGMVVPEAMIFGKPILCSKGAAAAELIEEGQNGYLFDPHNPEDLAEQMLRLIDDPSLIESMGARSREIIAQTTPETAARSFVEATEAIFAQQ
ncbi:glycosyltransferase family 4 protein [Lusitaniella coriacea LEGE 07157]|uniref:Glycosyltransferase family 4 protein n=1 Tax=Lusitaniella coriacea LEGE 07157 TaxID=945747 RepID=A0A8J7DX97_9CYAN|nr:glycosyltransferase family 4 protein [Lusitaniella coriacea]MBE9116911.1 glycosyltransferase family 4 protein [Lusitaniella coriacea LEGE 07157]